MTTTFLQAIEYNILGTIIRGLFTGADYSRICFKTVFLWETWQLLCIPDVWCTAVCALIKQEFSRCAMFDNLFIRGPCARCGQCAECGLCSFFIFSWNFPLRTIRSVRKLRYFVLSFHEMHICRCIKYYFFYESVEIFWHERWIVAKIESYHIENAQRKNACISIN